ADVVALGILPRLTGGAARAELFYTGWFYRADCSPVFAAYLPAVIHPFECRHYHPDSGDGRCRDRHLGGDRLPVGLLYGPLRLAACQRAVVSGRVVAPLVELSGARLHLENYPRPGRHCHLVCQHYRLTLAPGWHPGNPRYWRFILVFFLHRHVYCLCLHLAAVYDLTNQRRPGAC